MKQKPRSAFLDEAAFAGKPRKRVPFDFVLDELESVSPYTRPMFGCTSVYIEEKIVFILRDKADGLDDGVWIATTEEMHEALRPLLPNMRSISVLGHGVTGWQVLPADAPDFEESVLRACELVLAGDPRIGKVPKARRSLGTKGRAKDAQPKSKRPSKKAAAKRGAGKS